MKIVVLTTPRTGSHAFCEIQDVEKNLGEVMNIEDLVLPREENGRIMSEHFSDEFKESLKHERKRKVSYNDLFYYMPKIKDAWYRDYDENLNVIMYQGYRYRPYMDSAHRRRWENIKTKFDHWVMKIMHYHDMDDDLLDEILQEADKIYVLCRRNKVKQVISVLNVRYSDVFHTNDTNNTFNNTFPFPAEEALYTYDKILEAENDWIQKASRHKYKYEKIYYEDLDLSQARDSVKLNVKNSFHPSKLISYLNKNDRFAYHRDHKYSQAAQDLIQAFETIDWSLDHNSDNYNQDTIENYLRQVKNTNHIMPMINQLEPVLEAKQSKDLSILDIGSNFGILETVLKQAGYTDVEAADMPKITNTVRYIRSNLQAPEPKRLNISPFSEINLSKTYDVITCFSCEAFWHHQDIIHINHTDNTFDSKFNFKDTDGNHHTWMVPWKKTEWSFFIHNIKQYLNPEGVAIISLTPLRRDLKIPGYGDTLKYLKQWQTSEYFRDLSDFPSDLYIVVENDYIFENDEARDNYYREMNQKKETVK